MPSSLEVFTRTFTQFWPPASQWSLSDIPDLTGKVVLVTGGNAGIGKEMIKHLLRANAKVYLAARSRSKAEEAIVELARETSKAAEFLELDLGDLEKVKKSAEEFKRYVLIFHYLEADMVLSSYSISLVARRGLISFFLMRV